MRLGATFSRVVLYLRRNAIGVGLIRPKIVITMQVCEWYIRNLRAQTRVARLIRINKETIIIEYGRGKQTTKYNRITTNLII